MNKGWREKEIKRKRRWKMSESSLRGGRGDRDEQRMERV